MYPTTLRCPSQAAVMIAELPSLSQRSREAPLEKVIQ